MPGAYEPGDPGDVADLIRAAPLAWVISATLRSSPLPLLAELDGEGRVAALFGHCARRNPLVADFAADPTGLILFMGPAGFIDTSLVSTPDWVPTWNYTALRFRVAVELVPDETLSSVERLMDAMEGPGGAAMIDRVAAARRAAMLGRIVAFRARVTASEHDLKLGQDETTATFEEIVAAHPDRALAGWMRRLARSRRRPPG